MWLYPWDASMSPCLLCFFQTIRDLSCTLPVTGLSEEQIKPCDPSQGEISPSIKFSGTECGPAALANHPDSGPPTKPLQSLNTNQVLLSEPSLSTEPCRERPEAEEMQMAKRAKRTWFNFSRKQWLFQLELQLSQNSARHTRSAATLQNILLMISSRWPGSCLRNSRCLCFVVVSC